MKTKNLQLSCHKMIYWMLKYPDMELALPYRYGLYGLIIGAIFAIASSFLSVGNNLKVMFIMALVELGFVIGLLYGGKKADAGEPNKK